MDSPVIFEPFKAAPDIYALPSFFPVPGLGLLPVNAFLLKASEPVLVDTGLICFKEEFINNLASVIDPVDLRWLWLTHADQDHIGSLSRIMDEAPNLRVITSYFGAGRMSLFQPLPMERVYFLNPGQSITVGDRTLTAVRPPTFDSSETTGFFDVKSGAFFCADCFGAPMAEPVVTTNDMRLEDLRANIILWATIDSPWIHSIQRSVFAKTLDIIREASPRFILSGHLPVSCDMVDKLIDCLVEAPDAKPFVGPDQKGLETMLKGMGG